MIPVSVMASLSLMLAVLWERTPFLAAALVDVEEVGPRRPGLVVALEIQRRHQILDHLLRHIRGNFQTDGRAEASLA